MNIADQLPHPLNTFVVDVPANEYYDFELPEDSDYPLKGVTYPVDYGHIIGYTTEDKHELDLFVGNEGEGLAGSITVDRGPDMPHEKKFYVALAPYELEIVLQQLEPVLVSHEKVDGLEQLISAMSVYKDNE
jgi:hypothetical protein